MEGQQRIPIRVVLAFSESRFAGECQIQAYQRLEKASGHLPSEDLRPTDLGRSKPQEVEPCHCVS